MITKALAIILYVCAFCLLIIYAATKEVHYLELCAIYIIVATLFFRHASEKEKNDYE